MNVSVQTNDFSFELVLNQKPEEIGGEGFVYRFRHPKFGACVLKVYRTEDKALRNREKILNMIRRGIPNGNVNIRYCWPIGAAYDTENGNFIGFVMHHAFQGSHDLSILNCHNINHTIKDSFPEELAWHDKYELDTKRGRLNRVVLLCNWALALRDLYRSASIQIGDIKPENVMADPKTGKISLIDMDSCQIIENGILKFPATAQTPNYRAPEAKARSMVLPTYDSFSFGVCVYSILSGTHPFTNYRVLPPYDKESTIVSHIKNGLYPWGPKSRYVVRIPQCDLHKNIEKYSKQMRNLLDRTFLQTVNRPSFEEWFKGLKNEIRILKEGL